MITLDAGPLIALDKRARRTIALLALANEQGDTILVPAPALAQAMRDPARQARLSRLVRQPTTAVIPLDRGDAVRVGRLLAATGTSDIADAHVALCARRSGGTVVTSDPDDLRRIDPDLRIVTT